MSKLFGGLALLSVILSLFFPFSVRDRADAVFEVNGRIHVIDHTLKEDIGYLDGLKNGAIVVGYGIYSVFKDSYEMYRAGFGDQEIFGSVWLRKFWWALGIPISMAFGTFFAVIMFVQVFAFVAFSIKGGMWYYAGLLTALLLFLAMGRMTDREDGTSTPTGITTSD